MSPTGTIVRIMGAKGPATLRSSPRPPRPATHSRPGGRDFPGCQPVVSSRFALDFALKFSRWDWIGCCAESGSSSLVGEAEHWRPIRPPVALGATWRGEQATSLVKGMSSGRGSSLALRVSVLHPCRVGTAWAVQNRVKMAHFAVQEFIWFLFQRRKGSVTAL